MPDDPPAVPPAAPPAPRRAPAVPPVVSAGVACAGCGYDLSGTSVGGACPECGTTVAETIRRLGEVGRPAETNAAAIACLVLGILSLACCAWLGPVSIAFYVVAHQQLKHQPQATTSRTLATIGVVLGAVGSLLMVGQALAFTLRLF